MANHARYDDDERRAAARSADSLLNARNAARRGSADSNRFSSGDEGSVGRSRSVRERSQGNPGARRSQLAASAASAGRQRDRASDESRRQKVSQPARRQTSMIGFVKDNITFILPVVAVVAIVVLLIAFIRGCSAETEEPVTESAENEAYVSPYDWNNLIKVGDRYSYVVDGQVKSRLGIDVSDHQQEIDWDAVAADGIDFAMIRLGYRGSTKGDLYLDEQYWANIEGARQAGLDLGVYFFSQADTLEEAEKEANFVLENLAGVQLAYPVVFDSEYVSLDMSESPISDLSQEEMTAITNAFCKRIEAAGYKTAVYVASYDVERYSYDDLAQRSIWWAEYSELGPYESLGITMWQYTSGGQVAGIDSNVDMNLDLSGVVA